jgi:predicted unusual protein kinase regulating ubiquinone biosynthesis (AarF/ABC1/UbiB family)
VVVKVQRPAAETQIRQDLGLLGQFAAKAGSRPAFQQVADCASRCCCCCWRSGRRTPIQQLTEISVRHRVMLPSTLALIGKAFGQMQLAAAELDPSLDPFAVAGSFYLRQLTGRMRTMANPQQLFYSPRCC